MLFKSNGKFIDDVTDSFNRFGLQTKLAEKGVSKNTQKFEMYDSIHDSGYVAVAVDKPFGMTRFILSFVCYVCAALQNSALFTTIPENFRLKKTLENTELSRVLLISLFFL